MPTTKKLSMVATVAWVVAGLVLSIVVLLAASQRGSRGPNARGQAIRNLAQIVLAMHSYADSHDGRFPPPAIYSKDGKPLLSWRVLLLPDLEHDELHKKFHLDEPWNSAHNLNLLREIPWVFRDEREQATGDPHATYYRVFVGQGAAFEGQTGVVAKDFADGLGNTVLVVEAADPVPWTKPAELAFAPECSLPPLGGRFRDVFLAAMGDGNVIALPVRLGEDRLRAAITRSGNEDIGQLWDLNP